MTKSPSITVDFSEVENGMNVIRSMAAAVQSKRVREISMKALSRQANNRFLREADVHAGGGKDPDISHMYEWGRAGQPKSRLFSMRWTGSSDSRRGAVVFHNASMDIPVPISRAHEEYIANVNSERMPGSGEVRLARFVWLDKAVQLETKSKFPISVQGSAVEKDGWIRTRPGNPAPASALMVEVGGEIKFFKRFTLKYNHQGMFTLFFQNFWNENNFKENEFKRFERKYHRTVGLLFNKEINRARVSQPMFINRPGINFYSNGKKTLANVMGRERRDLIKSYEKYIARELINSAR